MAKEKILIIDDEEFNLDALERLLRKRFTIFRALSGEEALPLMKENDIDVIVSDQRMPGMTGIEVLKKSLSHLPQASRILLTGFTDLDSVISSINEAKIHMYLTKPWDNSQLVLSLEQAAEAASMRKSILQKNKELESAYQDLKSLDEAKTHFMTMINHELKTPLTTISSYLQILEEEADESLQSYLDGIGKGYDRLDKMIRLSLIIMEAKNKKLKMAPKKIDLEEVAKKVLEDLVRLMKKREIDVDIQFKKKNINFDPKYFEIIFYELLENAVRYADKGSSIQVFYDGEYFAIENKGSITKEKQKKIFEPYYVDESIMNHSNSTGLGISVSQSLLAAHGSKLDLNCENGRVSFFFSA